ncbi:MAG: hypothetical protein R2698_07880 [Microthrixaceae bacterium]
MLTATTLATTAVLVACSSPDTALGTPRRVVAIDPTAVPIRPGPAPATERGASTPANTVPALTQPPARPDAVAAPDTTWVVRPAVTAPPSALLDEITAVYDAAWADLNEAVATLDEQNPDLGRHLAEPQLGSFRNAIRHLREQGRRVEPDPGGQWRRVEAMTVRPHEVVDLEVCVLDPSDTFAADGTRLTSLEDRPQRLIETFWKYGDGWKWTAREWIDPSSTFSDCAMR